MYIQSVGLMRKECDQAKEQVLNNFNSLQLIRDAVVRQSNMADEISDSLEPVKVLLSQLERCCCLNLKAMVRIGTPATEMGMEELNGAIEFI